MRIKLINNIIKKIFLTRTVAASVLAVIIFTFLHCEFGLYDFDGDNHGSHDYSEIVKKATVQSHQNLTLNIFKLKVTGKTPFGEQPIVVSCINETLQYFNSFADLGIESVLFTLKPDKVYLLNKSFLI